MDTNTQCCPPFNPTLWEEKTIDFHGKLFVQERVRSFLHVPINFGGVMKRAMDKIEAAGAKAEEQIILSDESSLWGSNIFIHVTKEVPGAKMVDIEGHYFSKAFEGPYNQIGTFIKQCKEYTKTHQLNFRKMLFMYPLCPNCAKKFGKNYIVILTALVARA